MEKDCFEEEVAAEEPRARCLLVYPQEIEGFLLGSEDQCQAQQAPD